MASSLVNAQEAPVGQAGGDRRRGGRWVVPALVAVGVVAAVALVWSMLVQLAPADGAAAEPAAVAAVSTAEPTVAGDTRPSGAAADAAAPASPAQESGAATEDKGEPTANTGAVAVAGIDGIDLWDAPRGARVQSLPAGAVVAVEARSQDGSWLLVAAGGGATGGGATGWAEANRVIGFSLDRLPVAEVAALPALSTEVTAQAANAAAEPMAAVVEAPLIGLAAVPVATAPGAEAMPAVEGGAAAPIVATVSLGDARLNVRAGPGTTYAIIAKANPGDQLRTLGRDEAGDWLQVALAGADDSFGWVAAEYVGLNALPEDLPVSIEISDAPPLLAGASTAAEPVGVTAPAADSAAAAPSAASGLQGTLVFQSRHGGQFHAYDLTTGRLWPLTTGFDPAVSPDGQWVAFTRDGGENGIYVIDIDGSDERLIFSGRATLASPKWSPDGAWIVFSRGDEYVECYDFGRNMCLTEDELPDRLPPGMLDDIPLVKQYKQLLAVVDANGGNYRDVPSLESARTPDWSDRGIVYQSKAGLQWTADSAGAENRLVSFDYLKPFYHDPDWQPGSDRIAFMSKEASHWEIFVVNADGTGMANLTRPVTALVEVIPSNVAPAWSPDGQSIVYVSNRGEDNSAGAWRLWVMDAGGGNQRPLPIDVPIEYTFGDEQAVSWGP